MMVVVESVDRIYSKMIEGKVQTHGSIAWVLRLSNPLEDVQGYCYFIISQFC